MIFLFLTELLCKVLFLRGRMSLADLSSHVKLHAVVLESLLDFMRAEHLCELSSRGDTSASTFFSVDRYRTRARQRLPESLPVRGTGAGQPGRLRRANFCASRSATYAIPAPSWRPVTATS
ncbi:hypothetical protein ACFS07_04455 [Undibacterium arcticum]